MDAYEKIGDTEIRGSAAITRSVLAQMVKSHPGTEIVRMTCSDCGSRDWTAVVEMGSGELHLNCALCDRGHTFFAIAEGAPVARA